MKKKEKELNHKSIYLFILVMIDMYIEFIYNIR